MGMIGRERSEENERRKENEEREIGRK